MRCLTKFPFDVGDICVTESECYKALGKISTLNVLGVESEVTVLWTPVFDANLIGERALIKLGLVIDYKSFTVSDP